MCVSFSDMGHSKAEREIESHESGKTEIETRLKPFTIKTQAHQIEALDIVSEMMEISRSALVVKLINHYLVRLYMTSFLVTTLSSHTINLKKLLS